MSLYIGNLSARTRKDELERVFRRFGECDLRLKDGYGFVVYGFAPQAEKAMKLLQGRAICGQQLTITWSNKQPRPVGRDHRLFKQARRRDFIPRFRPGIKLPENGSDEVVVVDDGEEGDEEPGGRWGERAENEYSSNDGGGEAMITDRYDPNRGYDRRDKEGDRWTGENSGEREQDVAHGSMFQINCFGCGELGHKMRDCPTKRSKFKRFDNNNNNNNNNPYKLERYPRHRNDRAMPKYDNAPEFDGDEDECVEKRSEKRSEKKKKRESEFSKRLGSESANASASRSDSKPPKHHPRSRSRSRSVTRPHSSFSSSSRSVSKSRYSSLSPPPLDPSVAEIPEPSDQTTLEGVSVSVEEMCVALRHFGAEIPKEKHGSLEAWFGSARLWPWEGIYYRRVKKGPISVENYERRVAQNREFGIVDRFVRSSSGWGEISQKNP